MWLYFRSGILVIWYGTSGYFPCLRQIVLFAHQHEPDCAELGGPVQQRMCQCRPSGALQLNVISEAAAQPAKLYFYGFSGQELTWTDLSKIPQEGLMDVLRITSHLHKKSEQQF